MNAVRILANIHSSAYFRAIRVMFLVAGRYQTVNRSQRTCTLCDAGVIENEFHYVFKCKAFSMERKLCIQKSLRNMPSILEMHKLLNSRDIKILSKLDKFINIITANFA